MGFIVSATSTVRTTLARDFPTNRWVSPFAIVSVVLQGFVIHAAPSSIKQLCYLRWLVVTNGNALFLVDKRPPVPQMHVHYLAGGFSRLKYCSQHCAPCDISCCMQQRSRWARVQGCLPPAPGLSKPIVVVAVRFCFPALVAYPTLIHFFHRSLVDIYLCTRSAHIYQPYTHLLYIFLPACSFVCCVFDYHVLKWSFTCFT